MLLEILTNGIFPRPDDEIRESLDPGLEESNSKRAEGVAQFVRKHGKYRYGLMWAEYEAFLPDGRPAFLQASEDILDIGISGTDFNEHARWDRKKNKVSTFERRDPNRNSMPVIFYQVSLPNELIPETLTLHEVNDRFGSILGLIEQAEARPL